ncbi:MAG: heavy metal-associated domain-containing protein [Candidatus Coatesbacteria bacterium]
MADRQVVLVIDGMGCDGCVRAVTQALSGVPGVVQVEVNLKDGRATVRGDLGAEGTATLIRAVEEAGYGATVRPSA